MGVTDLVFPDGNVKQRLVLMSAFLAFFQFESRRRT